jgi:hypothetical protein
MAPEPVFPASRPLPEPDEIFPGGAVKGSCTSAEIGSRSCVPVLELEPVDLGNKDGIPPARRHFVRATRPILMALALLSLQGVAFGQSASATCSVSVRIVEPLTIQKERDLAFGDLVRGSNGVVKVDPSGTRTGNAGISFGTTGSTSALFTVQTNGGTFQVQLPSSVTLTGPAGQNLEVRNFQSATQAQPGGKRHQVQVGASLALDGTQPLGDYTGSYQITVAYN